jgi:hypothetical protein
VREAAAQNDRQLAAAIRADDPKYRRAGGKRATSLKTFRSDTRTQSIRAALSKVLLGAPPSTITLDKQYRSRVS